MRTHTYTFLDYVCLVAGIGLTVVLLPVILAYILATRFGLEPGFAA